MGFTDVFFCPLLANHLANIFIKMFEKKLSGLYHVVSPECLSKYEFGQRIAQRFNLDSNLIKPTSLSQSGLKAARSPNLTLSSDKLRLALGETLPRQSTGIGELFALYQQGFPQKLHAMHMQ
jgi:dTDP-4-dehydrorhamnose reductase